MTDRTVSDVIEDHRVMVGAARLHVSLGPNATPDALENALERIRLDTAIFEGFSPEELEKAKTERFKRDIMGLAKIAAKARSGSAQDMRAALDKIALADDMFVDTDMVSDMVWIVLSRKKRGADLPEGALERVNDLISKEPDLANILTPGLKRA